MSCATSSHLGVWQRPHLELLLRLLFQTRDGYLSTGSSFWAKQVEMDRVGFVLGKGRLIGRYIEEKDRFVGRYESFKHTEHLFLPRFL